MRLKDFFVRSALTVIGMTGGVSGVTSPKRLLACNMNVFTPEERAAHAALTRRLLEARREELPDGYRFMMEREHISVPELAEWVASEARCCPAVDFHLELPAFGPLVLRLDGGEDVKAFVAAELGL